MPTASAETPVEDERRRWRDYWGPPLFGILLMAFLSIAALTSAPPFEIPSSADFWRIDRAKVAASEPTVPALAEEVTLPDAWHQRQPEFSGTVTYKILSTRAPGDNSAWVLYIPRVGNQCVVRFNGRVLYADPVPKSGWIRRWYVPQLVDLPFSDTASSKMEIDIEVSGSGSVRSGLSEVYVGPKSELELHFLLRRFLQNDVPKITLAIVLAISGLFLVIWLRDPTGSEIYGYFGAGAGLFAIRSFHTQFTYIPWANEAIAAIGAATLGWAVAFIVIFLVRYLGGVYRKFEIAVWIFASLGTFVLFITPQSQFYRIAYFVWYLPIAIGYAGTFVFVLISVFQQASFARVLLSAAFLLPVASGIADLPWYKGLSANFDDILLNPIVAPLALTAVAWMLANDIGLSRLILRNLNLSLERRVQDATIELEQSYAMQAQIIRQAAAAEERVRIMQDVHDGVGSQLAVLLHSIENSNLPNEHLAGAVLDTLDSLHLLVDIRAQQTANIAEALLDFRHRLLPRLFATGLELKAEIDESCQNVELDPSILLHIMRVVQELVANAIRHASATAIQVSASIDSHSHNRDVSDPRLTIAVSDNGSGFNPEKPKRAGRGLVNIKARAESIKGTITINSSDEGTTATFSIPLP